MVRVDSLKLFELSTFSAEMRRGGESIPIILPYLEMPIIGGLLRWPVRPDRIYHRSIVVVSAVIQPTAADLASVVRPQPDMVRSPVTLDAKAESSGPESFRVVATRQDGAVVSETVNASRLDDVKFTSPGPDWKVKVYQEVNGQCRIPGAVAEQPCPVGAAIHRLTSISPQALLAGSVPEFHKRKLRCIDQEAHGEACPVLPLHNLPSIQ